jgi:hypothetical protein
MAAGIDEKGNLSTEWNKKVDELIITAQFSFIRRDSAVDFEVICHRSEAAMLT